MVIKNYVWLVDYKIVFFEFLIIFYFLVYFEVYVLFIFIISLVFFYV